MLNYYAKVETSIQRSVRIQQYNRYPKGKDGQPKGTECLEDKHFGHRVDNLPSSNGSSTVTLKTETQVSAGRQRNARCTKEDWKNQWSKWLGETLRQKLNKTNNTTERIIPQINTVHVSKNNQSTRGNRASASLGSLGSYDRTGLHDQRDRFKCRRDVIL